MKTSLFALTAVALASPVHAQDTMDHSQMDHGELAEPQQDHSGHGQMDMSETDEKVCVAIGILPSFADGSGTARLPGFEGTVGGACGMAATTHTGGLHLLHKDGWMVMAHGFANTVYTNQSGPRGDDKLYVQTMTMLMAEKQTDWGSFELRTMNSLEPLMSNRGYPSLFATGETAGGEPLVDRQHPHDFFMELSARVDVNIAPGATAFLYGGPVGEPAIGPSVFMHRGSATYNPEAPISHHWFDSTHITYGVVTGGISASRFQLEGSAFRGREPDEERWGIETPKLDSWSARATWTPTPSWAIQVSTGRIKSPEASHPEDDEQRTTASVQYSDHRGLSATAAFSNKDIIGEDEDSDAWLAEVNWDLDEHHTVFGRFENVLGRELFPEETDPLHEEAFRISKLQAGYAYRLPINSSINLALGGTIAAFDKPNALDEVYGKTPIGYTVFARLSLGD